MEATIGRITQVMGPVVDVEFPPGHVPEILNSLKASNARISDQPVSRRPELLPRNRRKPDVNSAEAA